MHQSIDMYKSKVTIAIWRNTNNLSLFEILVNFVTKNNDVNYNYNFEFVKSKHISPKTPYNKFLKCSSYVKSIFVYSTIGDRNVNIGFTTTPY